MRKKKVSPHLCHVEQSPTVTKAVSKSVQQGEVWPAVGSQTEMYDHQTALTKAGHLCQRSQLRRLDQVSLLHNLPHLHNI